MVVVFLHRAGRNGAGVISGFSTFDLVIDVCGGISDPRMGSYPPRVGGTLALPRGASPAARWLHEPEPISDQSVGLSLPHRPGWYRPGGLPFFPPGCCIFRYTEKKYCPGVGPCHPRVRRDVDPSPRGNCPRALAP